MAKEKSQSVIPDPGTVFNQKEEANYTINGEIRRGGMGSILLARDHEVDRDVAMKLLLGDDKIERKRFLQEAKLTGSLEHPNIVPIHSMGHDRESDQLFFTMKLIDGENLREILQQIKKGIYKPEDWAWPRLLHIFVSICHAVEFAHSKKIIHRDLKPSNIMVGKFGEVQVMDWGVAKDISKTDSDPELDKGRKTGAPKKNPDAAPGSGEWTTIGDVIGTIAYMPPEQALGMIDKLDARSDVYSLGAILYEILCLRPPIQGKDVAERLEKVENNDIEWPHCEEIERRIPRDLCYIVMKALSLEPKDRYQDVSALREDVEHFLEVRPVVAASEAYQDSVWMSYVDVALKFIRRHWMITVATGVSAILLMFIFFILFVFAARESASNAEKEKLTREHFERFKEQVALKEAAEEEKRKLDAQMAADARREWKLILEDDFHHEPDEWDIIGSPGMEYKMVDGELMVRGGKPHLVVYKQPVIGDIKIEFDCRLEGAYLNDVSCFMSAFREEDPISMGKNGYYFGYGSFDNKRVVLSKSNKNLYSELKEPLRAGKKYHVVATRIGNRLSLTVNDELIFDVVDKTPLSGSSRNRIGLFGYMSETYYDNVKIYMLSQSRKVDILELADYYMNNGEYETAQLLYDNAAKTSVGYNRLTRARAGVGKAMEYKRKKQFLDRYQRQADRAFRGGPRVSLTDMGLELDASGLKVSNLKQLQGLPFNYIDISDTDVSDLEPLRSMPIRHLNIEGTQVSDLTPLGNMSLEYLNARNTQVEHINMLKGKKLHYLNVSGTKVKKVNIVSGMPLRTLLAANSTVDDVAIFKEMPLNHFAISGRHITSIDFLKDKKLYTLRLNDTGIEDLSVCREMPLETLAIENTLVRDLSPLKGKDLRQLWVSGSPIKDFSILKGLNIQHLDVSSTKFNDLSLIVGKRIKFLDISYTEVKNLDPITKLIGLEKLFMFGCKIENMEILRNHKIDALAISPNLLPSNWQSILQGLTSLKSVYGSQTEITETPMQSLNDFMKKFKQGKYE